MSNLIQITTFKPEYSENILPITALITDNTTINSVGDGGVTISDDYSFSDNKSLLLEIPISSYDVRQNNFNLGDDLKFIAKHSGLHNFSFRMLNTTSVTSAVNLEIKVNVFINSLLSDTFSIIKDKNEYLVNNFYTFCQSFDLNATDEVNFTFEVIIEAVGPNPMLRLYFSGFKAEIDDRFLGLPSIYTKPLNSESSTGWESKSDTTNTISLTGGTNNLFSLTAISESNGGLIFLDSVSKVQPLNLGDFIVCDLAFTAITPSGADNYITIYFIVNSVIYGAQTFTLLKGSGNDDEIRVSFGLPVSSDFFANGGEFYIKPNVNLNIKNRFISVSRTHKGR